MKPICKYTAADFKSDQEVRWCPGCGDHAILSAVQRACVDISEQRGIPHNKFTFISGIGCSSRFIYYMRTFGFHTIHGRAAAVATGVKVANPDLSVWVATGDGDSLAIGGNHFIHAIRRNIDLNLMLFNNEIYGLTKGQYSPTTPLGRITKTSPYGTVESPFNPGELVIGAKGTFFARSIDVELKLTEACLVAGGNHKGLSVVEILQNCVIFNTTTYAAFAADKASRAENTITLTHGEKMLFGADKQKGLVFEDMRLKAITVGQDGYTIDDVLTHDAHTPDTTLHNMLAAMKYPELPVAMGVIRCVEDAQVYDAAVTAQLELVASTAKISSVEELLHSGDTWEVK
ncbi:MAG: 2-oxoacid:ferredoxin oxidoreductase subunit beta [Rikenellaceae bacterium]